MSLLGLSLSAQQDPQVSMNMFNHLAINPGYAGSNDAICVSTLYRNQWMGFEGAPKTLIFSGHMPIPSISSGAGLNIISDNLGFEKDMHINANYAYRMQLGDGTLGIGLGIGMVNKSLDGEWITPDQLEGTTQNPWQDPSIPHSESKLVIDFNFGAFFRTPLRDNKDNFYLGISTTHLSEPELKYEEGKMPFVRRHYYIATGYYYELPNKLFELRPSIFIKLDGATAQYDLNATLIYNKQFWGGMTYRFGDAFVAMVGYTTPQNIGIGLSYDITTSKLKSYESGSVEFMIRYCFNIKASGPRGTNKSVRYL